MKRIFRNSLKSAIILSLISLFLCGVIALMSEDKSSRQQEIVNDAAKKLESLKIEVVQNMEQIQKLQGDYQYQQYFLNNTRNRTGFNYYLLVNDSIKYWSNNDPTANDSILKKSENEKLLHLSNGDFLCYRKQWGDSLLVGLILVRHNYEHENRYLLNTFNQNLGLENFTASDSGFVLNLPDHAGSYKVIYQNGVKEAQPFFLIVLTAMAIALLMLAVFLMFRYSGSSTPGHLLMVLLVFLLRTATIYFKWPGLLYSLSIFDPSFYASSFYFNSLGDLLINSVLFLILSISIYENATPYRRMRAMLFIYWIATALAVHYVIRGLVLNSRLNFELSSPAETNLYSFVAYTSIALLLLSFLFITGSLWRNVRVYFINGRHAWIGITLCSLYAAVTLSQLNTEKEHDTRMLLAQKAEVRQDHVAEYIFGERQEKIASDTRVWKLMDTGTLNQLSEYIIPEYLSGYLSKFEITLDFFDNASLDSNTNFNYYRNQARSGKLTESKNLYFISNEGGANYLAFVPVNNPARPTTLVLTMAPRLFRMAKGFPELLMSGTYSEGTAEDYSIARYSARTLVYQYGDYIYPLDGVQFVDKNNAHQHGVVKTNDRFIEVNDFSHLIHYISPESFIIVSRPSTSLVGVLTLFSWMFIFMSVAAFGIFVLAGLLASTSEFEWNLTRKVQSSVLFLVVLIFTLVGTATVYFIKAKYLTDQNKSISDQVNALWFLVNDNLSMNSPDTFSEEQSEQFNRLVSNTNIDFNLYNREGVLLFSSQPKIYDMGIISNRMNRTAYLKILSEGLTQFIHPERTGTLKYIAAYAPFTDRAGKITAFLNLPYFEKQNELNRDVAVFLSSIVNIYVLLFALAVFVTIFISSRITKPLLLIQERMAGMRLGSSNEKIEYAQNDEIGQLVKEYNRMIDELADSAAKLSRSERESAWREMARQVAHEIKNPLTPMKLSVQHLHRTLKDGTDKEMIDRITVTLINQIDSLSNIATAFSNFAKMPQSKPQRMNVKEVLSQVMNLYDDANKFRLHAEEENYFVHADPEQLKGVFSNLLKNAMQSIPAERRPEIDIYLRREAGCIVTEIADNGTGIPEDQKDKIFIPNFTTKSSGMGLGLAIARNIVEEVNGKIWFTSTYGKGSSFLVSLPEDKRQL